jgi:hypothetical protein
LFGLRQEIQELPPVERGLPDLAIPQTFFAPKSEIALKLCDKAKRVGRQDFGESWRDVAEDLDTRWDFRSRLVAHKLLRTGERQIRQS